MKDLVTPILSTVIAVSAVAAVTVLAYVGKVDGESAVALLSAVVGAGLVHAGVSAGTKPPS